MGERPDPGSGPRAVPMSLPMADGDLPEVLTLNQHWVPHVGGLEHEGLARLVAMATMAAVVRGPDGSLDGFVIVLGPGADYASPNYRYFADRHDAFSYVDRIAVAPAAQGSGVGRDLYAAVVDHAREVGAPVVCAEVNLDPPNPDSLAFHAALGFVEVGRQWTYDDTVEVQLLERPVDLHGQGDAP